MVKSNNWLFATFISTCFLLVVILTATTLVATTNEVLPVGGSNSVRADADLKITSPVTAQELWDEFYAETALPNGVTNFSVEYSTGANYPEAAGLYTGFGTISNIDPDDGILLTSGKPTLAIGPNNEEDAGFLHPNNTGGGSGDADLFDMLPDDQNLTYDACLLTLKFTTDTSVHGFTFDFVFGTDEYPEYVNSPYNDIFCAFLDGKNVTFDHDGNYISVNNNFFKVPNTDATKDFNDKELNPGPNANLNLEYDGFTPLLRTSDKLTEGEHVLKFAICDVGDEIYDAGVFLSNFKFEFSQQGTKPVTIAILHEQMWQIFEDAKSGEHVGDIKLNTSNASAVKVTIINNVPEFKVDSKTPFGITVADGASFDASKKDSYILTIVASAGSGQTATSCTTNVLVIIKGITDIVNSINISNILITSLVSGSNIIINGLSAETYNLSITNLKGQEMLGIHSGIKKTIDISAIPAGIYFISIKSKNRKVLNKIYISQ